MTKQNPWVISAMVLACGQAASLKAQDAAPAPSAGPENTAPVSPVPAAPGKEQPSQEESAANGQPVPAPVAATPSAQQPAGASDVASVSAPVPAAAPPPTPSPVAPAELKPIRFSFQEAPYAQVMDFLARETGLPVIKESPLPDAPVTFISAAGYSLEEALDVLNRMLFMHGLQVRRDANFLLVTKIENMAPFGPVGQGKVPDGAGLSQMVTVVLPLQNASAAALSEQLKPLVTKVGGITPLPTQNSLVIVDTAAQCERLRAIITMLDAEPPSDAKYKIFPLKNAKAEVVFGALKGLLSEKRTMQIVEKDGQIRTVKDEQITGLSVQPYAATNSIVAIGPEGRLRTVEELVALLDRESSEESDRSMMTFALVAASADDAAARVTSLFSAVAPEKKPTILPLKEQGKLTIVGTPSQLTLAANLIGEVDPGALPGGHSEQPGIPAPAESRASLIRLKHTSPAAAQSILSRLLSPRQLGVLRYAASPDEKGLIVSGPTQDVEAFEQLLNGIDVPPQLDTEVRQVLISMGDPKVVAARAVELFALTSRSKTDPVSVKLEADSRTVTLVGSRAGLGAFTESLSAAQTTAGVLRETRSFEIAKSVPSLLAAKLLRLAKPMLEPADGSAYLAPTIEPVDELRKLIVRATPEQFAVIEQLVRSIDLPEAGMRQFRMISVPSGSATELASRVQDVFKKQVEGLTPAPSLDVTADESAKSLAVVADTDAMARFDAILTELQKQVGPTRELRLIELRHAVPDDVIAFLNELLTSSKPFTSQMGPEPVFEPIEATNSIMIAAQPIQYAIISELVKSLDQRQAGERPPLRIVKLKTTDAAGIAQILSQAYEQRPAEERIKFPVQITADAATNTLIVSAHPDAFTEIERITAQLNETQSVDATGREIRIFPLKVARAEELARTIDEMYPAPPMPRDRNGAPRPDLQKTKEVVVRADRGTNALIVDAPSARMAGFEQLLKQLDQTKIAENVELRTYRVMRAELTAVANTLRATAANGGLTGGKPTAAGVSAAITVEIEPMSRTLIVSGPSEIFSPVEKLLTSLDAAPAYAATGVKMYSLKHARAERLQPLLSKLLASRLREQQQTDGLGAMPGDLQSMLDVASDAATNTLIISAPESIQQIAEQLIQALDTPAAQTGRAVIRVVPLTYADANQAAQTLNSALGTIELPSGGRVTVLPTVGSNALLLSGAEIDLKKVEELMTSLDVRPMTQDAITVETFTLKQAEASVIAPMVQGLLQEKQTSDPAILRMQMQYSRGQLPRVPQIKVEADTRTNSLVVSGPAVVTQLAKAVIERLDQPADETGRISRAFTPGKANPADLVRAVQPVVLATTPAGRKPIELIAVAGAASIVVIGTEEQVMGALRTLAEFDDRTIGTPVVEVQVVDLKHTDAEATGRAVQSMLAERSRWPEALRSAERAGLAVPVPTVNADTTSNRLIIAAPVDLMPVARQLIDVMDRARSGGDVEVRVFPLKKSKAESVARAITAGFAATAKPADPVPSVAAEATSNSVVVSGTAARLAQAEAIVTQLDETAQPDGIAVRTIQLKHARAEAITPVLESLLAKKSVVELLPQWERGNYLRQQSEDGGLRIAAEPRLNAVVVTGPVGMIEVAEQIVRELDTDGTGVDPSARRSVRIIPITNADAETVAANIEAIFKDDASTLAPPTIRVDKESNSLILRATQDQIALIQSLVKELDEATYSSSREMRLVPIDRSKADAMIMAQTIQRVLQQRSGVQVEIISAEDLMRGEAEDPRNDDQHDPKTPGPKPKGTAPKKDGRGSALPGLQRARPSGIPEEVRSTDLALAHLTTGVLAEAMYTLNTHANWPDPFSMWQLSSRQGSAIAPSVGVSDVEPPIDDTERADDATDSNQTESVEASADSVAKPLTRRPRISKPNPASILPGLSSRLGQDENKITIAVDPRTNSLIVTSSPRQAERIAALAMDLQSKMPAEPRKVRVVTLPESSDAAAVSNRLEATIRQVGQSTATNPGGFTGRVTVQSDPAGGALIVSSNDTDFQAVSELIVALSRPGPSSSLTLKVYPLTSLTAASATRAITDLLSSAPRGAQARRVREQELTIESPDGVTKGRIDPSEVRIVADPSGTALIIAAPARAFPVLDRFVEMLDQSPSLERSAIREFAVKNAKAADAARTLQAAFDAIRQSSGQRRGPDADRMPEARFIADDRTGTLLVTGSDTQLKEAERLLATIDAPLEDDDTKVEIIALQLARPSAVREIVQAVLIGRDEAKKDRLRLSASDDTGLFVIRGTPDQIEQAKKIVEEVDKTIVTGLPIRSVKLERADAQAVAQGLQKFFEDRARVSVRQGQRAQARQVAIVGDRRTSTLVIAAADEDFEQIKSMITTFDAPSVARDLQFRVIPLEKARVAELRTAIENMVENLTYSPFIWWGGGNEEKTDKLVVEFNERANSVVLMGQGESFDAAEKMIKSLDAATPVGSAFSLRAVRVKHSDPSKIADAVQTALATPGWRNWRGADPDGVRAIPDQAAGTIILVGREDRVAEAERQIALLDSSAMRPDQLLETIPLKFARAERLSQSLTKFFNDRAASQGKPESGVSILGSPDGNVIIVQGQPGEIETVKGLLSQMDQPEEGEGRVRELYQLKNAKAMELATVLREQFPRALSTRDGLVIVTPQPSTDSVIVSAPAELFERVDALVKQLDAPPSTDVTKMVTMTLSTARAEEAAAALTKALPAGVRVTITPVRRSNSLLLTGSEEAIAVVIEQVEKLDQQVAKNPTEFRRVKLEHAEAFDVASTIRTVMRNREKIPGEPDAAVSSSSSDNTLLFSATSDQTAEIQKIIKELDVPQAVTRTTEFVPLKFADAEATSEALGVFYGRYAPEAITPSARNVTIIANPVSKSLVVSADELEWPKIRSLIDKLDNETYDTSNRVEIIALKDADATSLARTLNDAFSTPLRAELERERARQQSQPRRGEQGPATPEMPTVLVDSKNTISVSADVLTNSLVVFASREQVERIRGIVSQLDVPEFSRLPAAQIIPLRTGLASTLAGTLRQLFVENSGAQPRRSGPRSIVIVGDDKSNSLIVRADDSQFSQIKSMADALQQEGDRTQVTVRVLRLASVPAARIAASLRTTFAPIAQQAAEPMTIEIDRGTNSLVVASSEKIYQQIKAVASELDGAVPAAGNDAPGGTATGTLGRTVLIIDVENNSAEAVKKMLEEMGVTRPPQGDAQGVVAEPVQLVSLTSRRAIAVIADARDAQTIVSLVRSLDSSPMNAEQKVVMVRLKIGNAQSVASALESMLRPAAKDARSPAAQSLVEQVRRLSVRRSGADQPDLNLDLSKPIRIEPEQQTNSILIASTADNVNALSGVVEMLDRLPIGEAVVVRFFPLENAAASRVATVVNDLFSKGDLLRTIPATQIRGEPTTEVGKALAAKIAVSIDERTNALVVAGREEAVALVEVLIRELDGERASAWVEPRVIALKNADATRLADTLRQVLVTNAGDSAEIRSLRNQIARLRIVQAGKDPSDPASRTEADVFAPLLNIVIIPEKQANSLICVASPSNLKVVQSLVELLDVPGASASNSVRVFPLQYAAADRVGTILRDIFKQQIASAVIRPEDDIFVATDTRTNTLVVSTSPRSFTMVESLLEKLDGQEARPLVGVHVLPVPNGNVTTLAPKIERLMRDRMEASRRQGDIASPQDTFSIQPEVASNSLIVAASDENLKIIQQLLEVLTKGAEAVAGAAVVDVIAVQNSRAEPLVAAVRELYVEKEIKSRGEGAVRVTADARLNALIVSGSPSDIEAVRAIVARLDATEVSTVTEMKRIELKKADASEVVRLLRNVLAGRPVLGARTADSRQVIVKFIQQQAADELKKERGTDVTEAEVSGSLLEQVQLDVDARSNSVYVAAPSRLMVLIETMISDLDATDSGARTIEVFALKNADASQMADLLGKLFNLTQERDRYVLIPSRDSIPDLGANAAPSGPDSVLGNNLFASPDARQALAITVDSRTNRLLVSATAEYLEQVRTVVQTLDQVEANEREQITYELRNAKALEVAATLREYFKNEVATLRDTLGPERAGSLLSLLEREVTVQGDEKSNRLLVALSPRYREAFDQIVKELDATPPQVLIQVLLAEVTLDSNAQWGIDMRVGPFGGDQYNVGSLSAGSGVAAALGMPNLSVSSTDFELLIRALETQGRLEVLSRPQVLVKNNEPARMQVGEKVQIADRQERLGNGNISTTTRQEDVGIILNVTPSISADGFVSMEIQPEISALTSRTTQVSENLQTPVFSVRQLQTSVMVKDGETIVIGGLIQTNDEERSTKVPLLGDLPVIGGLFKSYKYNRIKTELLMILTPKVIRSGKESAAQELLRQLTREEIQRLSAPERLGEFLGGTTVHDAVPVRPAGSHSSPNAGQPAASPAEQGTTPAPGTSNGPSQGTSIYTQPSPGASTDTPPMPGPFNPNRGKTKT